MNMFRVFAVPLLILSAAPALAQETPSAWTGEGAFNAGFTTGNTETTDVGLGLKLRHDGGDWVQSGEFVADYGETDDVESKNRMFTAGQIDRIFDPQLSAYGRLTWERDEFSGFENRYFAGLGLAWKAVDTDAMKWTIEGGPGFKVDEVRETLTTPASTEEAFGVRAGSKFDYKFNDAVSLGNSTEIVYSKTSTQISNIVALTANLWGNLSARVSLDVRHDTDPLPDFEATDTATKFSLVYKIS